MYVYRLIIHWRVMMGDGDKESSRGVGLVRIGMVVGSKDIAIQSEREKEEKKGERKKSKEDANWNVFVFVKYIRSISIFLLDYYN